MYNFSRTRRSSVSTSFVHNLNGTYGIRRTNGDYISQIQIRNVSQYRGVDAFNVDTTLERPSGNKRGQITVPNTLPPGTYTLEFRARDIDGWSLGWKKFTFHVTSGTAPIARDITKTLQAGVYFGGRYLRETWDNGAKGITKTESDRIRNVEFNGTIPGLYLDVFNAYGEKRGLVHGTVTNPGVYTVGFKAKDTDGWSDWATLTVTVTADPDTSDVCYSGTANSGSRESIFVMEQSGSTLTHISLALDNSASPTDGTYTNCGTGGTVGNCTEYTPLLFGSHTFSRGTEFNMTDFAPHSTYGIFTEHPASSQVFDGTNLYINYTKSGVVHIGKVDICPNLGSVDLDVDPDFKLIFGGQGTAVLGDMSATGDSILYVDDPNTDNYAGNLYDSNSSYTLTDPSLITSADPRKQNASTASLVLPSYVHANHIKWAGLFWQGYAHTPLGGPAISTISGMKTDVAGWNQVRLKTPDGIVHNITANQAVKNASNSTYYYSMVDHDSYRFFYSAYVDITSEVRASYGAGNTFTVGEILTTAGKDYNDGLYVTHAVNSLGNETPLWYYDTGGGGIRMGYFGGWSIAVVYDLIGTPEMQDSTVVANEKYKNVSIYNGYDLFMTWGDDNVSFEKEIALAGFKTPKNGSVDSKFLFFGGAGDQILTGDTLQIQQGNNVGFDTISNGKNPAADQFNSSYSVLGAEVNPAKPYHHGMDMDIFDVSGSMINDQNTTKLKFGTKKTGVGNYGTADQIFPQVLGFSTSLYVPELCYDYDVRINDFAKLAVDANRTFTAHVASSDQLNINIMLKNVEADFDLVQSKAKIVSTMPASLSLNMRDSKMSPPGTNAYLSAIPAPAPFMVIGSNPSTAGGIIGSGALTYAKYAFDPSSGITFTSTFDIEVNASIRFSPLTLPIPYYFTSAGTDSSFGHMNRCDVDKTYSPVKTAFNVERGDSLFTQPTEKRYPLYTQIVGRDFNLSIASYTGAPGYNTEHASSAAVELELIDASGFENNGSLGYDSICQDTSNTIGTATSNPGTADLFDFAGNSRISGIQFNSVFGTTAQKTALRNAAFRTWVLTKDDNGSRAIVNHGILKRDDSAAWDAIYASDYKTAEDNATGYCLGSCTSSAGDDCYQCLKKYFAVPSCSRDNFAIRPESFRVAIIDNNETNGSTAGIVLTTNNPTDSAYDGNVSLAAQYLYTIDANATNFNPLLDTVGYYNFTFVNDTNLSNGDILPSVALLEYKGNTSAPNPTHRSYGLRFRNSQLASDTKFQHDDVGPYAFWIRDANWTEVDQTTYPYKTRFDSSCTTGSTDPACSDCVQSSTRSDGTPILNKIGCVLDSDISDGTLHVNTHVEIPLDIEPWKFDLSVIAMTPDSGSIDVLPYVAPASPSNYVFMHNINTGSATQIKAMSASMTGRIKAQGKLGTTTRNFFANYYAKNVNLIIGRDVNATTSDGNATTDTLRDSCNNPIAFTQSLIRKDGTIDTPSGTDNDTTLKNSDFFVAGGTGKVALYSNFTRSDCSPSNPFTLLYKELNASSPESNSSANLGTHIPRGKKDINNSVTYYYAKVTPQEELYNDVYGTSVITPLSVDIYCYDPVNPAVCAQQFGLHIGSKGKDASPLMWHQATMFDNANDGNITDLNKTQGMGVTINPQSNFLFSSSNGTRNDINVSVGTIPQTVRIDILTVPWLQHTESVGCGVACTNQPADFEIRFLKKSDWAGVGKTGSTAGSHANDENTKRLNW